MKKAVVLVDGFKGHFSNEIDMILEENDIMFFVIPANTSYITQPLDLALFGAFKNRFRYMEEKNDKKRINNLVKILESYHGACTPTNIVSSFKAIGLELRMKDDCTLKTVYVPSQNTKYIQHFGLEDIVGNFRSCSVGGIGRTTIDVSIMVKYWENVFKIIDVCEIDVDVDARRSRNNIGNRVNDEDVINRNCRDVDIVNNLNGDDVINRNNSVMDNCNNMNGNDDVINKNYSVMDNCNNMNCGDVVNRNYRFIDNVNNVNGGDVINRNHRFVDVNNVNVGGVINTNNRLVDDGNKGNGGIVINKNYMIMDNSNVGCNDNFSDEIIQNSGCG